VPDFRCDHVPPCPGLPGHQALQRAAIRKAVAARAAERRRRRGSRPAPQVTGVRVMPPGAGGGDG